MSGHVPFRDFPSSCLCLLVVLRSSLLMTCIVQGSALVGACASRLVVSRRWVYRNVCPRLVSGLISCGTLFSRVSYGFDRLSVIVPRLVVSYPIAGILQVVAVFLCRITFLWFSVYMRMSYLLLVIAVIAKPNLEKCLFYCTISI